MGERTISASQSWPQLLCETPLDLRKEHHSLLLKNGNPYIQYRTSVFFFRSNPSCILLSRVVTQFFVFLYCKCLWRGLKFVARKFTGRCELQRICYNNKHGARRTLKIGRPTHCLPACCLTRSFAVIIKGFYARLNNHFKAALRWWISSSCAVPFCIGFYRM